VLKSSPVKDGLMTNSLFKIYFKKALPFSLVRRLRVFCFLLLFIIQTNLNLAQAAWADIDTSQLNTKSVIEQPGDSEANDAEKNTPASLTVDDVKIEGNRLVPTEDIMGVVKTKPGDKFDREMVMQDLKAINGMGYFDDRNMQVLPEMSGSTGGVLLKIRVQENAPITQFAFQGNKVLSTEEIEKLFSEQLGRPQNLNSLSSAIDKVEQAYHEKGYVLARVTDVKDDPDGSVGLNINEGTIDKIEIVGNKKTKDFIVRNAIKLKSGDVYNERQLTADLRKLFGNGYFQDIRRSLGPSPNNPDKYVLKVEVDEKRTGSVGLGGGVDSLYGPFGSFSIGDSNFNGKGQTLSFTSQVGMGVSGAMSGVLNNGAQQFAANIPTYQAQLTFVEPNLAGTGTTMAASLYGRDLSSFMVQYSQQRTLGTGVTFSKSLGNNFNASLGLSADQTSLMDTSSYFSNVNVQNSMASQAILTGQASTIASAESLASSVRNNQLKGGAFASISPSINYDTRDNFTDPTKGTLLKLSSTPSLGLASASFIKLGASASQFIPVSESVTLATNIQGGQALGGLPQFGMYRLGGFSGMPGYQSLTALGTGTSMLMSQAELRARLPFLGKSKNKIAKVIDKHVKGVVFFDAGQVGGNSLNNSLMSMSNMGVSTGVGLRLSLPMVGVIRLYYGFPLVSTLLGGRTPRITVGFGDNF
jgi:outer membrane protein insertion porin family